MKRKGENKQYYYDLFSVDTEEDLKKVEQLMESDPLIPLYNNEM